MEEPIRKGANTRARQAQIDDLGPLDDWPIVIFYTYGGAVPSKPKGAFVTEGHPPSAHSHSGCSYKKYFNWLCL